MSISEPGPTFNGIRSYSGMSVQASRRSIYSAQPSLKQMAGARAGCYRQSGGIRRSIAAPFTALKRGAPPPRSGRIQAVLRSRRRAHWHPLSLRMDEPRPPHGNEARDRLGRGRWRRRWTAVHASQAVSTPTYLPRKLLRQKPYQTRLLLRRTVRQSRSGVPPLLWAKGTLAWSLECITKAVRGISQALAHPRACRMEPYLVAKTSPRTEYCAQSSLKQMAGAGAGISCSVARLNRVAAEEL